MMGNGTRQAAVDRCFSPCGQSSAVPRGADCRETGLKGQRAWLWRLASWDDRVGLVDVAFAAVGAEGDVHAGGAQDAFGKGLFG